MCVSVSGLVVADGSSHLKHLPRNKRHVTSSYKKHARWSSTPHQQGPRSVWLRLQQRRIHLGSCQGSRVLELGYVLTRCHCQ